MKSYFARFTVLNLVGAALAAAAWVQGWLLKPFEADSTHMCYLITALFVVGLTAVAQRNWPRVRWVGNTLVYLGMVGTVVGLVMTVESLTTGGDDLKQLIDSIYIGSGTALYTNLVACVGYLWLGTNAHLLAREEV